jgi:hypothetical protein
MSQSMSLPVPIARAVALTALLVPASGVSAIDAASEIGCGFARAGVE